MKRNGNNRVMMASKAQMPRGWRLVRLGDVLKLEYGVSLPERVRMDGNVPVIGSAGVVGFHSQATTDGPGIVVGRKGSIGLITWTVDDFVAIDTTYFVVPIDGKIDLRWAYYLLTREDLSRLNRATGIPGLNRDDVYTLTRLLPPLPEQRAIAAVLDSIGDAIEGTEAVIAATEQLRDSLLYQLLTRGIPGWHTEWKEVPGLGTIPVGWEVVRLGDVAQAERGKFAHRPRNEPRFYGGDIPFIQTGDVVRANGRIKEHSQTLNDLGLSISRLFPARTIIVTIAANIGETAIADYPVAFPDSLVGVIPHGIDTKFLE
jgi:type I restriction enzyme S subunit